MVIAITKRNETELAVKLLRYWKDGVERIRTLPGRVWVLQESVWTIPYTLEVVEKFLETFSDVEIQVDPSLQEECYLFSDG
ncbi:hypothetical protein [Paenibacillus puerhi]|uniref:hypothetical protein n=1 Tax=Paenibacillus puerhi TaxID=2692622 RepID=UPI0013585DAF|nr:hypothetical protein [Paenibacillus puerhi]